VEILVAASITGMLVLIVFGSLGVVARSSVALNQRIDRQIQVELVLDQICTCIRSAKQIQIDPSHLELLTSRPLISEGGPGPYKVSIQFDPAKGQLLAAECPAFGKEDLTWYPLLSNVRSLRFQWFDAGQWSEGQEGSDNAQLIKIRLDVDDGLDRPFHVERSAPVCQQDTSYRHVR
jgi:hypothetical protein